MRDLPPAAAVLEIGCSDGVPAAQMLVERGFSVTGVDTSRRAIARARKNVPGAKFHAKDIFDCRFEQHSFDAILSFWAVPMVRPYGDEIVRLVEPWLKHNGLFVCSVSSRDRLPQMENWFTDSEYGRILESHSLRLVERIFNSVVATRA